MKKLLFLILVPALACQLKAQQANCTFKKPIITINFGAGYVADVNNAQPSSYRRVGSSCPTDGHYTFTSYTSGCFGDDWHTVKEDYTPGDMEGNMMLVNASYGGGEFLRTSVTGFKSGADYEVAVSMMNVCRPTEKCPFPLLPNITIRLQTPSGKTVVLIRVGEIGRRESPQWSRYRALFTAPAETNLTLVMVNSAPGGCGNDFALDDIIFRECEKKPPVPVTASKKTVTPKKQPVATKPKPGAPVTARPKTAAKKPAPKKETPKDVKQPQTSQITKPQTVPKKDPASIAKSKPLAFPPPPPKLTTRTNPLVKQIETERGEIRVDLYDNGIIDGDTVSIYHNNKLVMANARLSQKPLTIRIVVDDAHPHHELVMVAENLGSIPPNTSLMKITAGTKHYEVFISSTEQKNAKVVFNLKE